jgi:hypothetical protein
MTGFLFGLALGLFVGFLIGAFVVLWVRDAREREVDAIFARYREDLPIDLWPVDVKAVKRLDIPLPRREP